MTTDREAVSAAAQRIVAGRFLSFRSPVDQADAELVADALLAADTEAQVERLQSWRNAVIEECAKVADEYGRPSPLHNYGPQGASREEKATMQTGRFIAEDIRALAQQEPRP